MEEDKKACDQQTSRKWAPTTFLVLIKLTTDFFFLFRRLTTMEMKIKGFLFCLTKSVCILQYSILFPRVCVHYSIKTCIFVHPNDYLQVCLNCSVFCSHQIFLSVGFMGVTFMIILLEQVHSRWLLPVMKSGCVLCLVHKIFWAEKNGVWCVQ